LAKDGRITLRQSGNYTPLYLRMKEQA